MKRSWCVYMLRCADATYYTGVTNDLVKRLAAHRAGTASKYTRCRLPVQLAMMIGAWRARGPALSREAQIKTMSRKQKQDLIREVGESA